MQNQFCCRLHDRKMCVLGLCSLINMAGVRPTEVTNVGPQIMPASLVLFQGLKRAYASKSPSISIWSLSDLNFMRYRCLKIWKPFQYTYLQCKFEQVKLKRRMRTAMMMKMMMKMKSMVRTFKMNCMANKTVFFHVECMLSLSIHAMFQRNLPAQKMKLMKRGPST